MEHCDVGEFYKLWARHIERTKQYKKKNKKHKVDSFLSARGLWILFECIASVAHIMTFGCLPGQKAPHGWERIIHRDIKAENGE